MIFVRFHATDIPIVLLTRIEDILLDIITEASYKQELSVFGGEDQMYHKQVFIVSSMLVLHIYHLTNHHNIL